ISSGPRRRLWISGLFTWGDGAAEAPVRRALPLHSFPGPAPKFPIHSRGRPFPLAPRAASHLAQPRRHPRFGAQKALQETGHIEIRIQRWKVDAEARWTDLDLFEL